MYIAYILNSIAKKLITLGNAYKLRSGQLEDILLNLVHEEKNSDKLKPEDFAKIIKLHRRSSMEEAVLRSIESSFCKAPVFPVGVGHCPTPTGLITGLIFETVPRALRLSKRRGIQYKSIIILEILNIKKLANPYLK